MSARSMSVTADFLRRIQGGIAINGARYVRESEAIHAIEAAYQKGIAEGKIGGELRATLNAERCPDENCNRCAILANRLAEAESAPPSAAPSAQFWKSVIEGRQ